MIYGERKINCNFYCDGMCLLKIHKDDQQDELPASQRMCDVRFNYPEERFEKCIIYNRIVGRGGTTIIQNIDNVMNMIDQSQKISDSVVQRSSFQASNLQLPGITDGQKPQKVNIGKVKTNVDQSVSINDSVVWKSQVDQLNKLNNNIKEEMNNLLNNCLEKTISNDKSILSLDNDEIWRRRWMIYRPTLLIFPDDTQQEITTVQEIFVLIIKWMIDNKLLLKGDSIHLGKDKVLVSSNNKHPDGTKMSPYEHYNNFYIFTDYRKVDSVSSKYRGRSRRGGVGFVYENIIDFLEKKGYGPGDIKVIMEWRKERR